MSKSFSRSQQQIFQDLYRELRTYNPGTPEAPERLDPILRILMQMYAHQLERIDKRLDMTWDIATSSLIKSVCPERGHWPIPAYTVMRCKPVDPMVEVDRHTQFYYKEKREGGKTFFFSPLTETKLLAAEVKYLLLRNEAVIIDIMHREGKEITRNTIPAISSSSDNWQLYIAVDYTGPASGLTDAVIFLQANPDVLGQLRWAYWYPGALDGTFYRDAGFCPGKSGTIDDILRDNSEAIDWGSLRRSVDIFTSLANNFVRLPAEFTDTWEPGPIEPSLEQQCTMNGIDTPAGGEHLYWMRLDLPKGGSKAALLTEPVRLFFDSFIVTNKNELTLFKHTGGNRLIEIEIPEHIDSILEIVSVVDSNGRDYRALDDFHPDPELGTYSFEERGEHLVLWFDFSSQLETPPDSITVMYAVTAGTSANGIEAGKIRDLYENHPGIESAENIIATSGAIPAKTQKQVLTEASTRLRQRDRAMTFDDIANWTMTFDPRIKKAICSNGIERIAKGVRRCVVVPISIDTEDFFSEDEINLLKTRLSSFLKARSVVNTQYTIEVVTV